MTMPAECAFHPPPKTRSRGYLLLWQQFGRKAFHGGGHRNAHSTDGRRIIKMVFGDTSPGASGDNVNNGSDEQRRDDDYGKNLAHDRPPSSPSNNRADHVKAM